MDRLDNIPLPAMGPTCDMDALVADSRLLKADPDADQYLIAEAIRQGVKSLERIPVQFRDANADVLDVQVWVGRLLRIASQRPRPNITAGGSLALLGNVGTGKTYQAFGAIRALALSGAMCSWLATTCPDMYGRLRPRAGTDAETEFRRYADARVLLLDDLGAAKNSEWTEEINYRLINHRYENHMPTLLTTNWRPSELGVALGDRVASRLAEMTMSVVLTGPDRRRTTKESA
jgi:DNA replication protein DnaC